MRSTQFRSSDKGWLRAAAARMLIATAAVGLVAGCGGDDNVRSTSETGGDTTGNQLVAHLTGSVVDTNGAPIEGAQVGVAGESTETNENGQWRIDDVPVVNVQNNSDTPCAGNGGDSASGVAGGCTGSPLRVTVSADGYLGGHTFVTPEGQIFSSENAPSISGDSDGQTNPQVVFTDGMLVQAENLVLPQLGAQIKVNIINASGQPYLDGDVDLDFLQADDLPDLGGGSSNNDEQDNEFSSAINFAASRFDAASVDGEPGSYLFAGLPADSRFNLSALGQAFNDCNANEPPDVVDICTAETCESDFRESRTVTMQLSAKQVTSNEGDVCQVRSNDVESRVDYAGMEVKPISPTGDQRNPYLTDVAGQFNVVPLGCLSQSCDVEDGEVHGLLNEGVNQSFVFTYSEELVPLSSEDVLVYNINTDSYIPLADTDPLVQDGNTVTINLADPLPNGTFFRVYLLTPGHRDLANNILLPIPVTNQPDPVLFDEFSDTDDFCDENGCPGTTYVAVRLCTFFRPNTDPDAPQNANQERFDPRLDGDMNDWPVNQGRSSAFNDVRDQGGDETVGAFGDLLVQQFNADGNDLTEDLLGELAFAFGESVPTGSSSTIGEVDGDVARVEWDPVDEFETYQIVVERSGAVIATLETDDFGLGSYTDQGGVGSLANVETGSVDRDGTIRNFFIFEEAQAGDTVTVSAVDDLGNPGSPSMAVTIVDNVEPTVVLQRSYQDLHDYSVGGVPENQNGCTVRPVPLADGVDFIEPTTTDVYIHAGVESEGGDPNVGSGGEVSTGSTPDVTGNVCIGISPELLIDPSNTEGDIETAHDELVAERSAALSTSLTDDATPPLGFSAAEIYDDDAFPAWPVMARQVGSGDDSNGGLGVAFSEELATLGAPTFSGTTTLSNYSYQGNTSNGPRVNAIDRPDLEYLVRVTAADALQLANVDAGEVIDFTGITDEAGNVASTDAVARAQIRDQWAPYMTSAFRLENGDLQFTWNEPVVIQSGDVLTFSDAEGASATFTFSGPSSSPNNYSISGDRMTVTIDADDVPGTIAPLFDSTELVYDDQGPDGMTVDDSRHLVVDWRTIADDAGNSWEIYLRSFADGLTFFDDVPLFALVDTIGEYVVNITNETVVGEAESFIFELTSTQPTCNLLDGANTCSAPAVDPLFDDSNAAYGCTGTPGTTEVVCDEDFVSNYLLTGSCTVGTASEAVISANLTTVTFDVVCEATQLATGETVGVNGGAADLGNSGQGVSALDETQSDSWLDATTAEAPAP